MKENSTYYTTASDFKSQFVEMFDFKDLEVSNPSNDFEELCFDATSSATKIPASEYKLVGKYPIFDQSQDCIIAGYSDSKDGVCEHYPAVLFGDHSRVIKFIDEPFFIGADGVKIIKPKSENIITKFLFYDLKYHTIPNTGYNRHFKYIKMLKLTKASIEDQQKFLAIAEQADKSLFELKKSIAAIDLDYRILFQQAQPNQANVHPCSQKGIVKMGKINYFCSSSCMKQTIYGKLS